MKLTERQLEAQEIIAGDATHIMLFGGSRCVSGETVLDGQIKAIKQLAEEGKPVRVITTFGEQWAEAPFLKGRANLLRVKTESGAVIEVTSDHRFFTPDGWAKADALRPGSFLAVRAFLPSLQASTSDIYLSELPGGVQHSTSTTQDYQGDYSGYSHQCDAQLHRDAAHGLAFFASSHGGLEHTHSDLCVRSLESDSQIHHVNPPASSNIHCGLSSRPLSSSGGSVDHCHAAEELLTVSGRIYGLSQGKHQSDALSEVRSCLDQLEQATNDSGCVQSGLFSDKCLDHALVGGFRFERVLSITETAEQEYYTLHVPITQQYFANGILHHNSGKTFLHVRNVCMRALKAPDSRHVILRFRFNHVKNSVIMDTFPKVMRLAFPGVEYKLDKTSWYVQFENGAQIWFGGLDDKERTEKILGQEYATIYLNECSQIPWASVGIAITRLAQQVDQVIGGRTATPLKPRMYYDCNPPNKAHWSYKLFIKKVSPDDGTPMTAARAADYAAFQINPQHNTANLVEGYLDTLKGLSARLRARFLDGAFADDNPNALFSDTNIETWRVLDMDELPDMVRIVVAVDPSGADDQDNADNDAIGIVVAGLGVDGNAYVLEDATVKAGPAVWGRVAVEAYDRWQADVMVYETNFGGAMVKHVLQTARARLPLIAVTASRGKAVRAEPFSALYEQGKVRHAGYMHDLEEELCAFSTFGYTGANSPNRADAAIWALAALFPALITPRKEKKEPAQRKRYAAPGQSGWMN